MTNREFIIKTLPKDRLEELRRLRVLTEFINKTIKYSKSYIEPRRAMKEVCTSNHRVRKIGMDVRVIKERMYVEFLNEQKMHFQKNIQELPRPLVNTLARMNAYKPFIKALKKMWEEEENYSIFHTIEKARSTTNVLEQLRLPEKDTYWCMIYPSILNLELTYRLSWD